MPQTPKNRPPFGAQLKAAVIAGLLAGLFLAVALLVLSYTLHRATQGTIKQIGSTAPPAPWQPPVEIFRLVVPAGAALVALKRLAE